MDGSAVKFGRSRQDAAEMLVNKFGNNASGVVSVQWKKSSPLKGGHIFNWKIKDGVVKFFDGQNNRDDSKVSGYWNFINANDSQGVLYANIIEDPPYFNTIYTVDTKTRKVSYYGDKIGYMIDIYDNATPVDPEEFRKRVL